MRKSMSCLVLVAIALAGCHATLGETYEGWTFAGNGTWTKSGAGGTWVTQDDGGFPIQKRATFVPAVK